MRATAKAIQLMEETGDPASSGDLLWACENRGAVSGTKLQAPPSLQTAHESEPPAEIEIAALRDARIRVLEPIRVNISRHGDGIVAEIADIAEYGQGPSMSEAIEDLQRGVAELFFTLEEDRESLAPDLERVHAWLSSKLKVESVQTA